MRVLIDAKTGCEAVVDYPGVTAKDVLDFCDHFGVLFYSMTAGTPTDPGLIRVGTSEVPSRGVDVSLMSISSWLSARAARYKGCKEGAEVLYKGAPMQIVGAARGIGSVAVSPVVLRAHESNELLVLPMSDFEGFTFDGATQSYAANTVAVPLVC